jgi:hypothetical protein
MNQLERLLLGLSGLVAVSSGLIYWIVGLILKGDEPFPVVILYRFGDTDYLSLIYALSRFEFHEFVTEGVEVPRLLSFPPGISMFYALPIALVGDYGFPLADGVLSVVRLMVCFLVSRIFFRSRMAVISAGLAIFVLTGPLPLVSKYWGLFYRPLWDMRYLRPFVTGLFALGLVVSIYHLYATRPGNRIRPALCVIHGVLIGLAAQGDLHLAIIASFTTAVVLTYSVVRSPTRWTAPVIAGVQIGAACLVAMSPMIVEVLNSTPDASRRLGEVMLSRLNPPILFDLVPWAEISALGVIYLVLEWRKIGGEMLRPGRDLIFVTFLLAVMSVLSTPLSSVILGRGIQIHHFPYRSYGFTILGYALVSLIMASICLEWLHTRFTPHVLKAMACGAILLLMVGHLSFQTFRSIQIARSDIQQRTFDHEGLDRIPGYRRDLDELWRELGSPQYQNDRVLGTFDQQLGMLWLTRPDHWLWLPDPFLTTVPDAAIEERVISLAKLVQMTPHKFAQRLTEPYFIVWVLGSWKWWPEMRLSESDRLRLEAQYAEPTPIRGRLDVVVLEHGGNFDDLREPTTGFRKTYENATFAVWRCKTAP